MKKIIIYDENYNDNKIIIEYTDHSFTKEDVKHLVLKYYKQQTEERAKKVEELLDLYRLQQEFKERYNTQIRLLDKQETLDDIREIAEEIYLKEKELEELK